MVIVALLHAVLEDTECTWDTIRNIFGRDIADFSQSVSLAHQHNISYDYVKSIAPEANTQAEKRIKVLLDAIMYEAYQLPIVEGNVDKMLLSEEFGKQVYLICMGDDYL